MENIVVRNKYAHAITSWTLLEDMEKDGSATPILESPCLSDMAWERATRLWQEEKKQDEEEKEDEEDREEQQKDELQQAESNPMEADSLDEVKEEIV